MKTIGRKYLFGYFLCCIVGILFSIGMAIMFTKITWHELKQMYFVILPLILLWSLCLVLIITFGITIYEFIFKKFEVNIGKVINTDLVWVEKGYKIKYLILKDDGTKDTITSYKKFYKGDKLHYAKTSISKYLFYLEKITEGSNNNASI